MTTLILAGGASKRMGRNKALIERPDGRLQLDHLVSLVRNVTDSVVVSSNDPSLVPDGIPILPDLHPGDGPLGALHSFAQAYPDEPVLLVGCDLFLLDAATLQHLIDSSKMESPVLGYTNRIDGRAEPLCAIYQPAALQRIPASLEQQQFCARRFVESFQPDLLSLPNPVALDNANTPADLDEAFAKLTHGVVPKRVKVLYFAKLREERGSDEESVETLACTAAGLHHELSFRHRFSLKLEMLRCARNGDFCEWNQPLEAGDEIVFIPPVAGG